MRRLRQRGKDIGLLVEPAALLPGGREHLAHRLPEPQRPVADGQHRRGHPAAAARPQQIGPRLGRLPVPVSQRDELLAAIGAHPDHHQQAELLLLEAHLEVDTVDPQVDVIGARQIRLPNAFASSCHCAVSRVIVVADSPAPEPRNCSKRRTEVTGRQPMQVQQRQHLGHLRGLARPRRQNRRGKPLPLTGIGVDALVVDPRRGHRHRPRRGQHLPLMVIAVAHHQPATVLVDLVGVGVDIGGDLGLQRRRQHLPGAVADDLIQQRPRRTRVLVGRFRHRELP